MEWTLKCGKANNKLGPNQGNNQIKNWLIKIFRCKSVASRYLLSHKDHKDVPFTHGFSVSKINLISSIAEFTIYLLVVSKVPSKQNALRDKTRISLLNTTCAILRYI